MTFRLLIASRSSSLLRVPCTLCIRRLPSSNRRLGINNNSNRRSSSLRDNNNDSTTHPYAPPPWLSILVVRLVAAYGMAHVVKNYGFELTLCEGVSMLPTIYHKGEIILVDKLTPRWMGMQDGCDGTERANLARRKQEAYEQQQEKLQQRKALKQRSVDDTIYWHQPMIPITELPRLTWYQWLVNRWWTPLSVGDLVVVEHPRRKGTVCKRILGLPGDIIVNPPPQRTSSSSRRSPPSNLLVIPNGHVWIEGDNSPQSADSRHYGPVPSALIVGKVLGRVWPLHKGSHLLQRGARPRVMGGRTTTVLPAGYEGQEIVKSSVRSQQEQAKNGGDDQ